MSSHESGNLHKQYVLESLLGLSFLVTGIVLVHLKVKVTGILLVLLKMFQGPSHWYCTRSLKCLSQSLLVGTLGGAR